MGLLIIQILVDILAGVSSGILASFISNHVINKRINQMMKRKEDIFEIYLSFLEFESKKIGDFGKEKINDFLISTSNKLKKIKKIYINFEKVESEIYASLNYGNSNNKILNKNSENYLDLITSLKLFLQIKD